LSTSEVPIEQNNFERGPDRGPARRRIEDEVGMSKDRVPDNQQTLPM
jgi:hypothetical protein